MKIIKLSTIIGLITIVLLAQLTLAGSLTGKVTAKKMKDVKHAVIYLDSVMGDFKPPEEHPVIDQKHLVFVPHILPVLAGTTVDFLNSDEVAHNVFSPDKAAEKFNLGTWPTGESRSYTFEKRCDKVCDAVMLCNVHPEMEAFVIIMQNPFFSTTDDEGNFTIENIPAGEYTLKAWHPTRIAESQTVVVSKDDSLMVEFVLKKK